jgi:hypothetical protein
MTKTYKVRCSPDCPYEWCEIITTIPPDLPGQQSMLGDNAEQGSDNDNSDSGQHSDNSNSNSAGSNDDNQPGQSNEDQEGSRESGAGTSRSDSESNGSDSGNSGGNGERPGHEQDTDKGVAENDGQAENGKEPRTESNAGSDGRERESESQDQQGGQSGQQQSDQSDQSSGQDGQSNGQQDQAGSRTDGTGKGESSSQGQTPAGQQPNSTSEDDTPSNGQASDGSSSQGNERPADGQTSDSQGQEERQEPEQSENGAEREQAEVPQQERTEASGSDQDGEEEQGQALAPRYKPSDWQPTFDPNGAIDIGTILSQGGGASQEESGLVDLGKHGNRMEVLTDQVFQARLRNVMKDNAFDRRVRGRKRGKLDMKSLYKVPAKVENVFTLKEARKNKHYNVILLVDQSGSMFSLPRRGSQEYHLERQRIINNYNAGRIPSHLAQQQIEQLGQGHRLIDIAADCAAFLAKSLDRVDVKYAVIGYDSGSRWHKKLDQSATDDKLKKIKYDIVHTAGGGTTLTPPLKKAYAELRKTPEYQNIVICISDGSPWDDDTARHFVKGNERIADFIDIGIAHKPIMANGIQIEDIEELKPLLIRELKHRIKRG